MSEDRIGYGERERIACADCGDVGQPGQAQPAQIGTPRGYICLRCHHKAQAAQLEQPGRRRHKHGPSPSVGAVELAAAVRWDSDRLALAQQLATIRALLTDAKVDRIAASGRGVATPNAELGILVRRARRVARLAQELSYAKQLHEELARTVPK